MNCIFCKIIAREIPSKIVDETDDVIVIEDIAPKAPIHWLIIPKKHIPDLSHLAAEDRELACNMLFTATKLAEKLPGSKAFRLVSNNGHEVGQRVFHIHLHFLSGTQIEF